MLTVLTVLLLSACGSQKSKLPPPPSPAGKLAINNLAHHPEVYADATITTVGTVARVRARGAHGHASKPLYQLIGGHGTRIVLEPGAKAAAFLGRRVRATGIFVVTFKLGYEILILRIAAGGSL